MFRVNSFNSQCINNDRKPPKKILRVLYGANLELKKTVEVRPKKVYYIPTKDCRYNVTHVILGGNLYAGTDLNNPIDNSGECTSCTIGQGLIYTKNYTAYGISPTDRTVYQFGNSGTTTFVGGYNNFTTSIQSIGIINGQPFDLRFSSTLHDISETMSTSITSWKHLVKSIRGNSQNYAGLFTDNVQFTMSTFPYSISPTATNTYIDYSLWKSTDSAFLSADGVVTINSTRYSIHAKKIGCLGPGIGTDIGLAIDKDEYLHRYDCDSTNKKYYFLKLEELGKGWTSLTSGQNGSYAIGIKDGVVHHLKATAWGNSITDTPHPELGSNNYKVEGTGYYFLYSWEPDEGNTEETGE